MKVWKRKKGLGAYEGSARDPVTASFGWGLNKVDKRPRTVYANATLFCVTQKKVLIRDPGFD